MCRRSPDLSQDDGSGAHGKSGAPHVRDRFRHAVASAYRVPTAHWPERSRQTQIVSGSGRLVEFFYFFLLARIGQVKIGGVMVNYASGRRAANINGALPSPTPVPGRIA